MSIATALALAISPLALLQGVTLVDGPDADAAGLAADYGSGVCRISVFGKDADGEQIRAEFSRRLRDGNLSVSLYGPFIRHFRDADPNANFPVTVAAQPTARRATGRWSLPRSCSIGPTAMLPPPG